MAKGKVGIPKPSRISLSKNKLLEYLRFVDSNENSKRRILQLENSFRERILTHVRSLPASDSNFQKFNTSPFVLMIHCLKKGYTDIKQIEADILPAKEFSSMETSAGRMIEEVTLPAYGWQVVPSGMHTKNSALDGKKIENSILKLATLKSGPRCLNDEMSENFADAIINNAVGWANEANVKKIDFTYGVLYGTPCLSNKKDWHILRNIKEKVKKDEMITHPEDRWDCEFKKNDITITVSIRIGLSWWMHLGGGYCFIELALALIRACVAPSNNAQTEMNYTICDLEEIISTRDVPIDFNVSILQKSQLEWFFFFCRHFCDKII